LTIKTNQETTLLTETQKTKGQTKVRKTKAQKKKTVLRARKALSAADFKTSKEERLLEG
jgi:hypothetical protein